MKNKLFVMSAVLLVTLACVSVQPTTPAVPNVETMVAATVQALTVAAPPPTIIPTTPPANGPVVSFENVSFVLPAGVATNALAGKIPAVLNEQQGAPWEIAPEHIKFELDGYSLYDTFHEPYILVYPAQDFAALNEVVGNNITRVQALVSGTAAPIAENLPSIPYFNAGQLFAAQIQIIHFANGSGVRFLTEYGQYFATANNHDLFYQFQGLTSDGKYYIIAVLPASHPLLAFDEKPETVPPAGGIPFPGYDNESALTTYYTDVVNLLNSTASEKFTPALTNLDALIQSLNIQ